MVHETVYHPGDPTLNKGVIASTTVTASVVNTTETLLHSTTIAANTVAAGDVFQIEVWGRVVGTDLTVTLKLRWGGVAGTLLLATHAMQPVANGQYYFTGQITARSATSFWANGIAWVPVELTELGPVRNIVQPKVMHITPDSADHMLAPTATVTVASNADKDLSLTATYSGNTAGNSITVDQVLVRKLRVA